MQHWHLGLTTTILLGLGPVAANAQQAEIGYWSRTGVELLEKCNSTDSKIVHACGEYMRGILDGVVIVALPNGKVFCPADASTYAQLEQVYIDWAKANPEKLVARIEYAASWALAAAYPCPQ
jgi:hypothetical protein